MTRFSKIFFWFLLAVLVIWQLPWGVNYLTTKKESSPFTMYSAVLGDFVRISQNGKELDYLDRKENSYTREQFDSLLPLFYARQLVADGRFPDSICGRTVTPREAQMGNFIFRSTPKSINAPSTGLYFLLESMSGRVDLTIPDDVFRLTNAGIEFVKMEDNKVDAQKSDRFTEVMRRKGVIFPVREIAGEPSARKEYDEGYVLLDADHKLFHLKMVQGRPYVRAVEVPQGVRLKHLFITEFRSRRTLALMSDEQNCFYTLLMPDYKMQQVEGVTFDPERETMTIIGTLLSWTVSVSTDNEDRYYAVSSDDLSLLDTLTYPHPDKHIPGLTFTSSEDLYVKPRMW